MSAVAFGVKVPPVVDDQVPPVAPPPTVPPSPVVIWSAQMVWLPPVLAVAAGWMVTVTCATASAHGVSWPVELSVSVTAFAEISAADGV